MEVRFVFKNASSGKPRSHSKRLPILIGRSDSTEIKLRIPTDSVSRRHCEFFLDESGRVCVRDLESTNGTFLDGKQLESRVATPVPSKCVVKLGNVSFRVEYSAAAVSPSPHDSDTIPMDAEAEPPGVASHGLAAEPMLEVEELEPAGSGGTAGVAPTEPLNPSDTEPGSLDLVADEPAPAGDFGFLAESEDAAAGSDDAVQQIDDAPAADEGTLDDFLKGLS